MINIHNRADSNFPISATWEYTWEIVCKAFDSLLSNKNITSSILSLVQNPTQLIVFYKNTDPLVSALYFTTGLIVIHYVMSEITKNYSQVDKAWSILPAIYAWHFTIHDYVLNNSFHPRLLAAAILISIWGTRLTYNFARKGGYYWSGQDYRYPYLREKLGAPLMALLNIVFIAPFQDYLLLLMVTPLYITNSLNSATGVRTTTLNTLDYIAIISHLTFLLIETIADEQQYVFQTEKYALLSHLKVSQLKGDYKHGFLWHSGLFQYSRHANFFAEMSMWWVIYLFSVSAVQEVSKTNDVGTFINWTIAGPLILTGLFQGSTWLTEVIQLP
ncbi:uncharacterized protein EV154DRAFT_411187 [Mucor mucedo]|uniref:uncharacterized protein n=1 Tax=Mucor mucedo TaxID=29922 RepID=UPI00221EAAB0|nr:uncharacterized protein EV154DRAFT_411187 [Mucor mucedo]KAI7896610.1 hypothetical protein EV154DRAFT_411187 [Mucor mucedo]